MVIETDACMHLAFYQSMASSEIQLPPLAQTNREIREEALNYYFGRRAFKAVIFWNNDWERCKLWLRGLGESARLVRRLEFWFCFHHRTKLIVEAPEGTPARIHVMEEEYSMHCDKPCELVATLRHCRERMDSLVLEAGNHGFGPEQYCKLGDMIWYEGPLGMVQTFAN